jgi:DNA-binding FadR family transcriptional regulator
LVFDQVRQGRISDNIVAQIKNAILTGIYKPGDKLPPEKELIRLFNVSRVPLREATRSLEEMGLITIKPGGAGGAFVSQMSIKSVSDSLSNMIRLGKINISDIWGFRLLIEPNICCRAAKYRTDWDLKQMEDMITDLEKAIKSRKPPIVSNMDFHQIIARAAKNPLSILIMDAIGEILLEVYKKFNFSLRDHKNILRFHKKIFECIKKKDTQKIGRIMEVHLMDNMKRLKNI